MSDEPERYPDLHAVPTKRLATNIVGSLIMAKGNINRWDALIERFLTDYRTEEKDREDLARRLAKECFGPWQPPRSRYQSGRERAALKVEACKVGLLKENS